MSMKTLRLRLEVAEQAELILHTSKASVDAVWLGRGGGIKVTGRPYMG